MGRSATQRRHARYLVVNDAYSRSPYQETAGVYVLRSGNVGINTTAPARRWRWLARRRSRAICSARRAECIDGGRGGVDNGIGAVWIYNGVGVLSHVRIQSLAIWFCCRYDAAHVRDGDDADDAAGGVSAGGGDGGCRRAGSGSGVGAVDVNTDGTVVIVGGSPADYFSIDGVVLACEV